MAPGVGLEPTVGFRQRINSPSPATNSDTQVLAAETGVEPALHAFSRENRMADTPSIVRR